MAKAIEAAKANDYADALRLTLVTHCHNPIAQGQLKSAGEKLVGDYLKTLTAPSSAVNAQASTRYMVVPPSAKDVDKSGVDGLIPIGMLYGDAAGAGHSFSHTGVLHLPEKLALDTTYVQPNPTLTGGPVDKSRQTGRVPAGFQVLAHGTGNWAISDLSYSTETSPVDKTQTRGKLEALLYCESVGIGGCYVRVEVFAKAK